MTKIRILIADDHAILRAGLQMLFTAQPDMEVVGHAETIHEVVPACLATKPDVLLQDLSMPDGSGISAISRVRQECPQTRILVLTFHDDLAYMRASLAAGAMGYIVKTASEAELMSAIRAVHQGRIFVDLHFEPHIFPSSSLAPFGVPQTGPAGRHAVLSRRELEVLTLLAQGHTNQQTADRLFLSVKTIETYRGRIAEKLGLRSRADIVRYAVETGLLRLSHCEPSPPVSPEIPPMSSLPE
jgi:two-component system response regulator NreC